ncbi:MAG: LD-carboxypeptidase [Nocardioides sp.]|nr:LD-carboxypeptidase [Nocardioides sp.]
MSDLRFPRPLRPGDLIGVTSPSSGVPVALRPRQDAAIAALRARGFEVEVGACMAGDRVTSAPKEQRAAELTRMLSDPRIRAVVPPWGGELSIDLLDQLDWDALAAAEPTWTVGYSDSTAWMLPLTLRLGWAVIHGTNLLETPYEPVDGLRHWTEIASLPAGASFTQHCPGRHRSGGRDDWEADPGLSTMTLDAEGGWSVLGGGAVDVTGRLVGGCLEILTALAGTPYGDVAGFGRQQSDEGLLVFVEACEYPSYDIARILHGLRLAGWFEDADAILVGRTHAPGFDDLSQHEAVADALGVLDVPVVLDVDCGHVQPMLPLVTGASARVVVDAHRQQITQTLA